jgi:hypothetical protein
MASTLRTSLLLSTLHFTSVGLTDVGETPMRASSSPPQEHDLREFVPEDSLSLCLSLKFAFLIFAKTYAMCTCCSCYLGAFRHRLLCYHGKSVLKDLQSTRLLSICNEMFAAQEFMVRPQCLRDIKIVQEEMMTIHYRTRILPHLPHELMLLVSRLRYKAMVMLQA